VQGLIIYVISVSDPIRVEFLKSGFVELWKKVSLRDEMMRCWLSGFGRNIS